MADGDNMPFRSGLHGLWRMAIVLFVLIAFAALIGRYLQERDNYDLCEVEEPHSLSGPAGQSVEMDTRFCSPLAGDPGTIVVRFRPAGKKRSTIVFAYNPTDAGPEVKNPPLYPQVGWDGPNRVLITINRLSQVQRQRSDLGDMHFVYRIGKIDYPDS